MISLHINSSEQFISGLNTEVATLVYYFYKFKVIKLRLYDPAFCSALTDLLSSDVHATKHLYTENSKNHHSKISSVGHL